MSQPRSSRRYGPGVEYDTVGKAHQGDMVKALTDPEDGWMKVQLEDGTTGWTAAKYYTQNTQVNG